MMYLFLILMFFQNAWQTLTPEQCSCSIYVPSEFEYKEQEIPTDIGQIKVYNFAIETEDENNNIYFLNRIVYPEGFIPLDSIQFQDDFLAQSLEETIENLSGVLDYSSEYQFQKNRALKFRITYNQGLTIVKGMYVLRKNELFLIQVFTSSDKALNNDMDLFLNSFKIL